MVRARKRRRIATPRYSGDLRCRESHDLNTGVIPISDVEVVKVTPSRADDDDAPPLLGMTLRVYPRHRVSSGALQGNCF
jgi:hypothetical protein